MLPWMARPGWRGSPRGSHKPIPRSGDQSERVISVVFALAVESHMRDYN
jgi:hypothetical protein